MTFLFMVRAILLSRPRTPWCKSLGFTDKMIGKGNLDHSWEISIQISRSCILWTYCYSWLAQSCSNRGTCNQNIAMSRENSKSKTVYSYCKLSLPYFTTLIWHISTAKAILQGRQVLMDSPAGKGLSRGKTGNLRSTRFALFRQADTHSFSVGCVDYWNWGGVFGEPQTGC